MKFKGCKILKKIEWYNYVNQKNHCQKELADFMNLVFFYVKKNW